MQLTTSRESLLKPLQAVIGVVERRQTMPILANVLLVARDSEIQITATDLEVELVARSAVEKLGKAGEITVPGRKLLEICRALPEEASVSLQLNESRLAVKCGRSRFVLSTLPAADFPVIDKIDASHELRLAQNDVSRLLDKTHFAMAQQDVRYYLNGLLLETGTEFVRAVATDGHRLAMCEVAIDDQPAGSRQVIIPRKGVLELQRLLGSDEMVELAVGSKHIRVNVGEIRFTSKLIDGRYPDYERVLPKPDKNVLTGSRDALRQALQRAAILSNEKYRGISLELSPGKLSLQANNPDQEEAHDEVEVSYDGETMEVGFNVTYLLDALAAVDSEEVQMGFVDPNSSCLIHGPDTEHTRFVVMPMRL